MLATVQMTRVRVDADGVRIVEHASRRRVVGVGVALIAVVLVATGTALLMLGRAPASHAPDVVAVTSSLPVDATAAAPAAARVASPAAVAPASDVHPRRRRADRAAAAATRTEQEEGELDARDVIPMLRAAGEREGIAAFPPPGTDPPKAGLIVPDDFVLPEGYVRHYQATDDGERLPAILMFHPDYEFVDAAGAPITLPENRVVPPELAPPGLPLETLDVPAPDRRP